MNRWRGAVGSFVLPLITSCVMHAGEARDIPPPPPKPPPWGTTAMPAATTKPDLKPGKDAVLRVVPFRLTFAENETEDRFVELLPDGTIMMSGKKTGQVTGNTIALTVRPTELTLTPDDKVKLKEHPDILIKLDNPPYSFTGPQGGKLTISSDHNLVVTEKDGTAHALGTWEGTVDDFGAARMLLLLTMAEANRPIDIERVNRESMQELQNAMDHPQ